MCVGETTGKRPHYEWWPVGPADRAAAASHLLLASPADVPIFLQALKADATRGGWDATFIASDPANSPPPEGAVVGFVPVRAKLVPLPANQEVFASLLQFTERLSASEKRIDLIRLSVRADEHRWQLVELNFRLCYALPP